MRSILVFYITIIVVMNFSTALSQNESKTTIGGYGELHYNEPDGSKRGVLDFHRFVVYLGHNFNEKISFHSEIEIEHTKLEAGAADGGEVAIEQAYLDYAIRDNFGVRAGILIAPVGLTNLYHEPPTFHGVERPNVERVVIPTTWRESGVGVYGTISDNVKYQAYVTAGLKAGGFSASSGIRGGRQEAFESNPANPSVTGRIDFSPKLGLQLGGSFFVGSSAAGEDSIGSAIVAMWSGDLRYANNNFSLKAVGALATVSDAYLVNRQYGNDVADRIYGFYVEGAYNFLPHLCPESEEELFLFARYEKYNTQAAVMNFLPLTQFNRNDVVFGLTYKPTYNTAFKFDYTFLNNALNTGTDKNTKQLNLGLGYYFN